MFVLPPPQETRPLEVMILERSKALQSENTNLRVERDRLSDELAVASKSLASTTRESERQQGRNSTLTKSSRHLVTNKG